MNELDFIDNSAVAVFVINPAREIIYWNRACEKLTGCKAEEMLGTSDHWRPFYKEQRPCLADIVITGDFYQLPQLYQVFNRSSLIPDGLYAEGWYENLGGKKRYIIFDAAPVHDAAGKLIAVTETLQDITEHKQQDEAKEGLLRRMQDILRANGELAGFLPVCSSCRDIRTSKGNWVAFEEYIRDASEARVTHGICPECARKLYPDIFKKLYDMPDK
ncbi:MAG: hypothetical protein A2521_12690 [Deltaproteobacteria bacterium RIFOXYD12_FULL_57_12]|nr:MAG: hypothetical protein A2521_12690 [Deltaproteobacteria bacterium RIFOXYD12_FULL_57_12]